MPFATFSLFVFYFGLFVLCFCVCFREACVFVVKKMSAYVVSICSEGGSGTKMIATFFFFFFLLLVIAYSLNFY